jgi:hypothetical protein
LGIDVPGGGCHVLNRGVSDKEIERNRRASIERPENHLFEPVRKISRKFGNLRRTIPVVRGLKTAITGETLRPIEPNKPTRITRHNFVIDQDNRVVAIKE